MQDYISFLRSKVGQAPLLLPSVTCIIPNDKGEILLQHRSDNLLWGHSGGMMEIGESVFEAMQREVREETSLEVTDASFLGIYSGADNHCTYENGDKCYFANTAFVATSYTGTPRIDHESVGLEWFDLESLPENLVPDQVPIFEDYKRMVNGEGEPPFVR